jgi:hypothetical protein
LAERVQKEKMDKVVARIAVCLILFVHLGSIAFGQADAVSALPELSKTKILENVRTPDVFQGEGELQWVWRYDHESSTKFLRLHLLALSLPSDNSWWILIKDGNDNVVERLDQSSFPSECPIGRWTNKIDGGKVTVELRSSTRPDDLKIVIDRLNFSYFKPGEKELTTGKDDMRDIVEAYGRTDRYYDYGKPIAIIFLQRADTHTDTNCTGFLLTPELMMTNRHCISEAWQLQTATAEFGYEKDSPVREVRSFSRIEMQSIPLDFTILRMASPVTSWSVVQFGLQPPHLNQQLILVQYPSARLKTISLVDCRVLSEAVTDRPNRPDDFSHLCDSEGGSSGAPLMDEATGRVVGLHYWGVYRKNKMGWNFGVKIPAILQYIHAHSSALCGEIAGCLP